LFRVGNAQIIRPEKPVRCFTTPSAIVIIVHAQEGLQIA
jgi:hypothetical protein